MIGLMQRQEKVPGRSVIISINVNCKIDIPTLVIPTVYLQVLPHTKDRIISNRLKKKLGRHVMQHDVFA